MSDVTKTSAIPAPVARRLQEIEQFIAQQNQTEDPEQASADAQQPELEQSETAKASETPVTEAVTQQPEQAQEQVQTQSEQPNELEKLRKQLEAMEHKYKTLAGIVRSKDDEIRRLQELIANFDNAPNTTQVQTNQTSSADEQKDIDDFGADIVAMVKRYVSRGVSNIEQRLIRLEQAISQTTNVVQETQKERFERRLTELVPDWREIDVDPDFATWLQSNRARVDLVRQYMAAYDADGVAEMFLQYKALHAKLNSDAQQPTLAKPKPDLERKVAPAKGRTSTPTVQPEKKVWTRSEIAEVYRNQRRYDAKTFAELEREIANAQREGRVDYTR